MSELEHLLQQFKQPEYVHVLLNPLPVYGLAMGVLALVVALLLKSRQAQLVALILIIVASASAWPVVKYGQRGYDRVYAMSYADAQQWLDVHLHRAERFQYLFYATALLAAAALAVPQTFPRATIALIFVTIVTSMCAILAGGWISHAGGQVRHSEFREGPPPASPARHEHTD
jgi:hypothetical protein